MDRAFGDDRWMHNWGHMITEYDIPNVSDHCPMILKVRRQQMGIKSPFRFFNVWANHKDFINIVVAMWPLKID